MWILLLATHLLGKKSILYMGSRPLQRCWEVSHFKFRQTLSSRQTHPRYASWKEKLVPWLHLFQYIFWAIMLIVYVTMVLLVCGEACWYFTNVSFLNDFPFWNGTVLFRQRFSISLLKIVLVLEEMALKLFLICFVELAPLAWHLREGNHLSFIVKFKSIYSNLLLFVDSYSLLLWIVNLWFSPLFVFDCQSQTHLWIRSSCSSNFWCSPKCRTEWYP